ncbi:MAG: fused MFS/spermidine synthase [Woeseia sp.]
MGGRTSARSDAIVYGTAVLAGAALVFQIQPLSGKLLLPAYGGGASVWTTCMFYFQTMLLAGYSYAHFITTRLGPGQQAMTHAALLLLSLVFLPVAVAPEMPQASVEEPGTLIFSVLLLATGFPFVLLASTAPLVQRWSSLTRPQRPPYRLYAVSNAGALLALLSYPFLVEPNLSLQAQTVLWSVGYAAFLIVSLAACRLLWRRRRAASVQAAARASGDAVTSGSRPAGTGVGTRSCYGRADRALTVLLSACGVVALLAITNQVTQNVAPIPFLWTLPLVTYLLTYILCFSGERWYDRAIWGSLFIVAASTLLILDFFGTLFAIVPVVAAYLLVLVCTCMVCHGELYRVRPGPRRLTSYYLLIALGGALGGAFVSIIAPMVFNWYWDALAGIYLVYLLLGIAVFREARGRRRSRRATELPALVERWSMRLFTAGWAAGAILFPVVAILLGSLRIDYDVVSARNFYGVLNVRDELNEGLARRILIDGTTVHGFQLLEDSRKAAPTSYYAADTGIGLLLQNMAGDRVGLRVGVVGLGAGTLAAYGQPGDRFRFYELNPAVIDAAKQHFSFLRDSAATVEIVPGDARLSMTRELADFGGLNYDLLVVDAFNSDAIPVHLLTLEAMHLYLSHLKPGGVLAFHLTNNYLDLAPVIARSGARFGKEASLVTTPESRTSSAADWVLLADEDDAIASHIGESVSLTPVPPDAERIWTDDYSDLLGSLRHW